MKLGVTACLTLLPCPRHDSGYVGPVAAENCEVDGPMPPAMAVAGSEASLDIQAYDQYGNPLDTSGGDVVRLQ